ncbi:MAG TPA: transcription elongation factor GreA [Candidatus Dojkabacteria bacterium]|nr:transcription elongation factor GreA [Candidatus Dojkabacteria bacterium]HQG57871.1 transcription elongation factor GreA [Candidatus Dojkabacteria bacterium]
MSQNNDIQLLTKEGYDELKKELEYRINEKRKEISVLLGQAKDMGDLSENESYTAMTEEMHNNEYRILELQAILDNSKIVENCNKNKVCVGAKVTVLIDGKSEKTLEIVGEDQADPFEDKISYLSPIGSALMKKKVGDKVEIVGTTYEIKKIV